MQAAPPTLQSIAAEFGVSSATVSNALSGKGRVSEGLAARLRARAEALGYAPSLPARALRTGRSGVIGLVLPDLANPLFPKIAQAVEAAAAREGYGVLIADSHGEVGAQTAALQRLVQRGADGIIVVPRRGTRVLGLDVPLAVIDTPAPPGNTVSADHRAGGAALAAHLLGLGHRAFALVGESRESSVQRDRIGGLRAGLPQTARIETIWLEEAPETDFPALARDGITAFAATSDLHALRILTTLQRAGLAIPREASVAGFDDLAFAAAVTPSLTTMAQDSDRIAGAAVAALMARIDGPEPAAPPAGTTGGTTRGTAAETAVPMTLIARESTGPAPASIRPEPRPHPATRSQRETTP